MSEISFAVEQLNRIHKGPAWHGPSLTEAVAGVSAENAARRLNAGAHSIGDLVHHIAGWDNVFGLRLKGEPTDEPSEGDFPASTSNSAEQWAELIARLDRAHGQLVEAVSSLNASNLEELVVGKEYTKRFLIDGAILHHVYHTGQIVILKRALNI
jgi:uncharacterized damage-inducible protein DinB